jgi:hypothetical protein
MNAASATQASAAASGNSQMLSGMASMAQEG